MAETGSRAALRDVFLAGYENLARRLTFRLGSPELAREALQETFLRLERSAEIGSVRNPQAYLLRTAFNIATNHRIAESRRLTVSETEALLEIARSEEHTSELQSLMRISYAVFCLKKKNQ